MNLDQRRHFEQMREIHRKRLMVLEEQAARFGYHVPPHIPIEIEELQEKIQQIDIQLGLGMSESGIQSPIKPVVTTPMPIIRSPSMKSLTKRNQVFISYSHKDEKWLKRLQTHLAPLERAGIVKRWDDTKILPGSRWQREIEHAIEDAKVAVLLISADFLASEFIDKNELPPLLAAAEEEGAVILPVIVGPSLFEHSEILSQFQAVNPPSEPLSMMPKTKQDAVLVKVAQAIKDALQR